MVNITIRIMAVSDIHSPLLLPLFRHALDKIKGYDYCVFILAGDIIDKGKSDMAIPVVKELMKIGRDKPIVSIFGNEEYESIRGNLKKNLEEVIWLDDSYTIIKCEDYKLGIAGTQGALDRLTKWQARNMPWLSEVYSRRPKIIEDSVVKLRELADKVIVVSHYVLARGNLIGEDPRIWPEMYSSSMEEAIRKSKPDLAIHGHAHKGSRLTLVEGIPVYNVALPLTESITVIEI